MAVQRNYLKYDITDYTGGWAILYRFDDIKSPSLKKVGNWNDYFSNLCMMYIKLIFQGNNLISPWPSCWTWLAFGWHLFVIWPLPSSCFCTLSPTLGLSLSTQRLLKLVFSFKRPKQVNYLFWSLCCTRRVCWGAIWL